MSTTSYDIAVRLSMSTAGFGAGAGMAMKLLGDLEGKSTQAEAAIAKLASSMGITSDVFMQNANRMGTYQTQIGAMTTAHNNLATAMGGVTKMAIGAGLIGVGVIGVGLVKGWVSAAGTMQDALTQVGIAAQGTQAQLQSLFTQSFSVANATQYSAAQILSMDQIMGRMNFNDPTGKQTQRQVIQAAIPQFARAAEIAQHFQGTGYEETITGLAQQAHMLGAYSGAALARNVGYSTELGVVSHMTAQEQARALSYLTPSLKTGQLGTLDAMALVAVANQTGLNQGKGGSNLGALLRGLAPTGAHKHDSALGRIEQLGGGSFYDKNGNAVPLPTALGILNRFYDSKVVTNERRGIIAVQGLGVQGARAASVLGSDLSIGQFKGLRARIAGGTPAASKAEQEQLNATLPGQLATLTGNMGSLAAIMGTGLLPIIAPIAHGFVLMTSALVDFLSHHKDVAEFVAVFTLVASTSAIVVGGILAISGAVQLLSLAAAPLGIELLPITAIILGIGAAVAAGVWIWQHWGDIMKALSPVMEFFITPALNAMGQSLSAVGNFIGILFEPIGRMIQAFGKWADVSHILGNLFSWMGDKLHGFLQFLGILHDGPVKAPGNNPNTIPKSTYKPGQVQPGQVIGGTVGLAGGVYIPPIMGGKGGGGGMMPATGAAELARHGAAPTTIHLHIAAGAVVNHIAPGHGHDPAKIADEVTTRSADALVKGFRDALAHSGTGPITTLYPTLHRTS